MAVVGSPLATLGPQQVTDSCLSLADLKVPGTSLHHERYRVVVVSGDSTEELKLVATRLWREA